MESAHRQESTDHNTGGVKFRALVGKGQFAVFCDGYRAESASARKRLVDVNLSIGASLAPHWPESEPMVTPLFASGLHSDKGVHSDLLAHACSGVGVGSAKPTAAGAGIVESIVKASAQRLAIGVGPPPCTTFVSEPPPHEIRHMTATKKIDARPNQGTDPGLRPKSGAASLRRLIVFPPLSKNLRSWPRCEKDLSIAKTTPDATASEKKSAQCCATG